MKTLSISLIFVLFSSIGFAQITDTTQNNSQTEYEKVEKSKETKKSSFSAKKLFFGGSLGFSFGSYTSIRIYPMIGYKLTPKLSVGTKFMYEYSKYDSYLGSSTYNNYGASVFSRFRFIPQAYAHAEYSLMNYDGYNDNDRYTVPYLLLGGGFVQRMGSNASAYVEILFDVLNDSNSPYAEWSPFYSVGVSVGF